MSLCFSLFLVCGNFFSVSGYQSHVRWKKTDGCKSREAEREGSDARGRRAGERRYNTGKGGGAHQRNEENTGKTYSMSSLHTLHMKTNTHTTYCSTRFNHISGFFTLNFLKLGQNALQNDLCPLSLSGSEVEVKGHTHGRCAGARWCHLLRWTWSLRSPPS